MDGTALRQIQTLFNVGTTRDLTDGQLLERFATTHGEAAELAFAALVERHGALVLRVCRARLADPHDAMDAFQATFLVLVRKARALWVRDSLGPWLHQVALRTASCVRAAAARRRRLEREAAGVVARVETGDRFDTGWEDVLHAEIDRLPERYRVPIVLCDLEGYTTEEAARRMGRPVGTVKCWRARGRERLRARLSRSGLAPSLSLATARAAGAAGAAVPPMAAEATARNAARAVAGGPLAGSVPAAVSSLVAAVAREMLVTSFWKAFLVLLALALTTAGIGMTAGNFGGPLSQGPPEPAVSPTRDLGSPPYGPLRSLEGETWPLSLREALRIGLDNASAIRLVWAGPTGSFVIEPAVTGLDPWPFKAEATAFVRSIEQEYWSLAQQHARLRAAEKAVGLTDEALEGAPAAGRDNAVRRRMEQLRLDLASRISDVTAAERRLRHILRLPPADDRRIVPVSPPRETPVEADWDASLAIMLEQLPQIAQAKSGEPQQANPGRPAATVIQPQSAPGEGPEGVPVPVNPRDEYLRQVLHQSTHSLARYFLELDANYKRYRAASQLHADATRDLEAQRRAYEANSGARIDGYLDAISRYADASALEGMYRASYNTSIVNFEEARGTLLERDRITLADRPQPFVAPDGPADHRDLRGLPSLSGRVAASDPESKAVEKTLRFRFTVGSGPRPIEVRGTLTIAPGLLDGSAGPAVVPRAGDPVAR